MFDANDDDAKFSKSERKRNDQALQALGTRLLDLAPEQLANLPVADELRDAVNDARRIRSHEAHRRQLQYIGRLMRNLGDPAPLRDALALLDAGHARGVAHQHHLEQWRSRLLDDGDTALATLLRDYPTADRQYLCQLIRQAEQERRLDKPAKAARSIFRYLSELMANAD